MYRCVCVVDASGPVTITVCAIQRLISQIQSFRAFGLGTLLWFKEMSSRYSVQTSGMSATWLPRSFL